MFKKRLSGIVREDFRYHFFIILVGIIIIMAVFVLNNYAQAKEGSNLTEYRVQQYRFPTEEIGKETISKDLWWYSASVSPVSEFFDSKGQFHTVYESKSHINLIEYSEKLEKIIEYSIPKPYPLFGGALIDINDNIYVVYGKEDVEKTGNSVVMSVIKYTKKLEYVSEVTYTGHETSTFGGLEWATKRPFLAGNCSLILNGSTLIVTYAREMYNNHQSSHALFVNTKDMKKIEHAVPYVSHSFDQQLLINKEGDYLFVDHGDAYDRGFVFTKIDGDSKNIWLNKVFTTFHFREGTNRSFGYNETYAQLGALKETEEGYVFVASSEKTLSRDVAPTNRKYVGSNEARNLFIQVLKKDFIGLEKENSYLSEGEKRKLEGVLPLRAFTELYLPEEVTDYGVIWLTQYPREYGVFHPKVISLEDGNFLIMWEKFLYNTLDKNNEKYEGTFFMVLSPFGEILLDESSLGNTRLTEFESPVYFNNKVYWSSFEGKDNSVTVHVFDIKQLSNELISK